MDSKEIKDIRIRLGLTQKEMASRVKVDAGTVSRWELGKQKPCPQAQREIERQAKRTVKKELEVNNGK